MEQAALKERAAFAAVDRLVTSGMKLGLGTGSTAIHAVRRVGALLAQGRLRDICAVATSQGTAMECENLGIPLYTLNAKAIGGRLDLTIDGADEVDGENRCVKGGGGALLLEKITAYASAAWAVVVDESKCRSRLGPGFPVPVEVVEEARLTVKARLEALGAEVSLREAVRKAGPVITEHGNLILDARFPEPPSPEFLEGELNNIPGVVENGFFTRLRPLVFIARTDGTVEERP
ncbi:MAG: ribose-5-phosphate isomerase RpiA [Spirochaetaceae bacterium]|jgi:ribose 5-phosphate isomerase A|nr:ribose-5-phosphate isomerase RpiA [Spirochaetaceae bacterium]